MLYQSMETDEWVGSTTAMKYLGISRYVLFTCAPKLKVRVRVIPGRFGRLFNVQDLKDCLARLMREEQDRIDKGEGDPAEGQGWPRQGVPQSEWGWEPPRSRRKSTPRQETEASSAP